MRDPAFNFYSDNFLSGTMFFSDEQVGKYIRLLCAQHQTGHLDEKHMIFICKSYDDDIWKKFKKDDAGLYYNERLENEINKRKAYSESRSRNKRGKRKPNDDKGNTSKKHMKIISKSYDDHMGIGIGIGIGNKTTKGKVLDFSFVEPDFSEAFTEWVDYKRSKGQTYKNQKSLEACYFNLIKLSGKDPPFAREIVFHSIANNYAGLYKPKNSEANDTKQYILNRLAGTV